MEEPESGGSGLNWFREAAQDIYATTPRPTAVSYDEAEFPETPTSLCLRCGEPVTEKDKGSHLKEHSTSDSNNRIGYSFQERVESDPLLYLDSHGRCRECHEFIPEGRRLIHIDECPERLEICYWCFNLVRARNLVSHELSGHSKFIVSPAFIERDVVFGDSLRPYSHSHSTFERYLGLLAFIALSLVICLLCTYFIYTANAEAAESQNSARRMG